MDSVTHKSNQQIVRDILAELKSRGHKGFTARPWNMFKPETTLWWLVPSTEWPAYKYGKIALFREGEKLNIGMHVEKGLSATAGQILPPKRAATLCTGSDWIWHAFLADIKSGEFEAKINRISQTAGKPLRISVQASTVTGDYEPYAELLEGQDTENSIAFLFENGYLQDHPNGAKGEMRYIDKISALPGLTTLFESKDMEWFWIDFYAVFEVDEEDFEELKKYADLFVEGLWGDVWEKSDEISR